MDRKRRLYQAIVEAGGVIPNETVLWRTLGQGAGYRGGSDLAGFFGGRYPSMCRDGDHRFLTEDGWRRARALGVV